MKRRTFLQATGATILLAACSPRGPRVEDWLRTDLFALCLVDGTPTVVAWAADDMTMRVAAPLPEATGQIAWSRLAFGSGPALLGWTANNEPLRFATINGRDEQFRELELEADAGDFTAVADVLYTLGPGARITGRTVGSASEVFSASLPLALPTRISAGTSSSLVLGNADDGTVRCVEVFPDGEVGVPVQVASAGAGGDAADLGGRRFVTVQSASAQTGSGGESALVEVAAGTAATTHRLWERPRLLAPLGTDLLLIDDTRGAGRVLSAFAVASGQVAWEHELASVTPVLGLRATADGSVAVLQTDVVTHVASDGSTQNAKLPGDALGGW